MKKPDDTTRPEDRIERYGGDRLEVRHGRINRWLLLVYLLLFVWALYYGWAWWGGLGPGLGD